MYYDYFLTHRVLQIQRLCSAEKEPLIDLPSRLARSVCSKQVVDLCRTIENICRLPLGDEPERKAWGWLKIGSRFRSRQEESPSDEERQSQPLLTSTQRELINQLETDLVRFRLGDDSQAVELAAGIMQAIWLDHEFFNGLKLLAAYTDNFAYEFLYPTWFNLYTALTTCGKSAPGFSTEQVKTVFRFLQAYENEGSSRDPELVGLMTLIVNRQSAEEAPALLQRLIDLCGCPESDLSVAAVSTVRPLRDAVRNVSQLLPLIADYLLVETGLWEQAIRSTHQLVSGGLHYQPVPGVIGKVLRQLEPNLGRDGAYPTLLRRAARIIDHGGFDADFERLLTRNEESVSELLAIMFPAEASASPLSPAGQGLVTRLLEKEQEHTGQLAVSRVEAFARQVAPRLERLDESTRGLWDAEFANPPANRRVLLDSCGDAAKRSQIASRLLRAAKKASDSTRFFDLVELAAILDPSYDDQRLERIRLSARVLRLTIENGYIVQNQLTELLQDLQEHLPASVNYLESPALAGSSKLERLSKLYLTLNEVRESYALTGRLGNFGMTYAAFRNLTRPSKESP